MPVTLREFLLEDTGTEDVTTNAIVPEDHRSKARIIAKADGIVAGHMFASQIFKTLDNAIRYNELKKDGERVQNGDILVVIEGKTRAILTGERVALNILQRLSGIATLTGRFVEAVRGTATKILDTRKTTPGLREMEKYAVRVGGGYNHRENLTVMALIKENHISAAGSIRNAVEKVRERTKVPVEVEVKNMDELKETMKLDIDRIMFDNWDIESTREAVSFVNRKIPLEASGNMTIERVREVAQTGVDFISVGALTHSFQALDMSLLCEEAYHDR
jgi:nicotinate-nucleotide pyrophosphorylase (carboxylating)